MVDPKRKPSQEDDLLSQADESLQGEPMDITGLETDKPSTEPHTQDRTAETIGRMVAGATPTLFGFLFGPQQSERGIAQTKAFGAAGKPSKLVPVVGPEGKPIYETPEGALGQEVYQKPSKPGSGGGLEKVDFVDPKIPGVVIKGYFNKATGTYHKQSGEQVPNAQDPQKLNFERVKDQYGNEKLIPLNPLTGEEGAKGKVLAEGIGAKPKIPEYAVKEADDVVKTHQQNIKPLDSLGRTIQGAMANLNASNADSVAQAAGIFQTAKAIAQEKMTDADYRNIAAEASVFSNLMGEFEKAISNEQRQGIVSQMRGVLVRMDDINKKAIKEYEARAITGYAGNDANKAKYIVERFNVPDTFKTPPVRERKTAPQMTLEQFRSMPKAQQDRYLKQLENQKKVQR